MAKTAAVKKEVNTTTPIQSAVSPENPRPYFVEQCREGLRKHYAEYVKDAKDIEKRVERQIRWIFPNLKPVA